MQAGSHHETMLWVDLDYACIPAQSMVALGSLTAQSPFRSVYRHFMSTTRRTMFLSADTERLPSRTVDTSPDIDGFLIP